MNAGKKGKRLNWLVALMTISLLGVTGIQAYWLTNAFSLREEKFDREVGQALSEVSERLENLESIRFLVEGFSLKPFFSQQLQPEVLGQLSDSGQGSGGLKLTMRMGGDTVMEFNAGDTAHTLTAYRSSDSSQREMIISTGPQTMLQKGLKLDMLLRKMVIHEMRRKNLGNLLDRETLDSLIRFELQARGIEAPYEFAVISNGEKALATEGWQPGKDQHHSSLFPNDFFNRQVLSLSFPAKTDYLMRSMWLMLIISLIFTSAIVFAFYRTLQFSMRQKRISDIKTDFINNMTHEFKTPLATINLAIDALRNPRTLKDPERVEHYSKMIKQENLRMNMQVESVLRMALMDRQELELNFKECNMQQLVRSCLDHVSLQLDNRNGQLTRFLNDNQITLKVDENHLSNAIINILDNAIKYSVGAPQIKIITENTINHFVLVIEDKGMGMTREAQKHIFDRFYRVSAGDLHNIKGHGLGLSYTKGIVEAHRGRIEVESEKGKGSKFYIYLPLN